MSTGEASTESARRRPVVLLAFGPNFNLLGKRQPELYGAQTLEERVEDCRKAANEVGLDLRHVQSNSVSTLVDAIHAAREPLPVGASAIIINPGAFTHYAWALTDALATFEGPIIEVHQTNTAGRESWRHTSVVAPVATATLAGLGDFSYATAVVAAAALLSKRPNNA